MTVSIIIPIRNEENNISQTIEEIRKEFDARSVKFEIVAVNDGSEDNTERILHQLSKDDSRVRCINNLGLHGMGNAIHRGLREFEGTCAIIVMADSSDDPKDMIRYVEQIESGYDCCFGNRWSKGAVVDNYPTFKRVVNRFANWWISIMFGIKYFDVTNAFKCYSRETIKGIMPILSHHFNVTVELPLKAIVRGYSYNVITTNWRGRKNGQSSLKIEEMGSRYLFITLYIWLEKMLSKGDYKKQ